MNFITKWQGILLVRKCMACPECDVVGGEACPTHLKQVLKFLGKVGALPDPKISATLSEQ